jgi:tetratricopeptide (TPR) repeat protein
MKAGFAARLLLLTFLATASFGQSLSSPSLDAIGNNIRGTVYGTSGHPLDDVRIEIRKVESGATVSSGYTNTSGSFEFGMLPRAAYDVIATKGVAEARERISDTGAMAPLTIRLNTADPAATQVDGNATVSVAEYRVPQKARDAMHKAEQALSKHNFDDVTKFLSKALSIYPSYAPALTLRGVLSLDKNQVQAAIDDFDAAIHADRSYAIAYTGMGAALNELKKFDEALKSCDRAVTLSPDSWQPYYEMSKSYVGKADYPHALDSVGRAQRLVRSDYAPLHLVRAHILLAMRNYNDAAAELQAFIKLAPDDPNSSIARDTLSKVKALTAAATTAASVH